MREDSLRLLFALIPKDIHVDIRMITTQNSQQGDETFISETPRELTEEREQKQSKSDFVPASLNQPCDLFTLWVNIYEMLNVHEKNIKFWWDFEDVEGEFKIFDI